MPQVAFRLDFKSFELQSLDLPIEIRKLNATLMARPLSTELVKLPAGQYYATASLPAGQRLLSTFEVIDPPVQDPLVVTLAPDPEDESPHEWEEVPHFLGRSKASMTLRPEPQTKKGSLESSLETTRPRFRSARPAASAPLLRVFSGNVVERTHRAEPTREVLRQTEFEHDRLVQFEVPGRDAPLIAQLVVPGGRVQNMALPVSGANRLRLVVDRRSGRLQMEGYLENSAANMLLQYAGAGVANAAATASRAAALDGEQLLMQKMADPIAAAVGAYALLRIGSLDQLHDWTSNLRARFGWLPDGAAICGEHLARLGRHQEAFEAFAEVPRRGLPAFADGLFYTVERVKLYASRQAKSQQRIDPARAQAVFDQLQAFAGLARRQRPITTYPGIDVAEPDTSDAPVNFTADDGLKLSQWFSDRGEGG